MIEDYTNVEEDQDSDCNQPSPGIETKEEVTKISNKRQVDHKMASETMEGMKSVLENPSKENADSEKLSQHQIELLKLIKEMEIEEKTQKEPTIDDAIGPKANFGRVVDDKSSSQPFLYKPTTFGTQQKSAPQHFNQPNPNQGRSIAASIQKNITTAKKNPYLSMETQRAMQNAPMGMSSVVDEFKALTELRQKRRARADNFEDNNQSFDSYSGSQALNSSYSNSYNYNSAGGSTKNLPVRTASFASIAQELSGSQKLYPEPASYQSNNYYGFKVDQNPNADRNNFYNPSLGSEQNLKNQKFGSVQQLNSNPRQVFKSKAVIKPMVLQTQPTAHHPTIRTTPHQIVRPRTNNPNQVITVRGTSATGINQSRNNFYQPSNNQQRPMTHYPNQYSNQFQYQGNNDGYQNYQSQPMVQKSPYYSQSLDRSQPYLKNPVQQMYSQEPADYSDF